MRLPLRRALCQTAVLGLVIVLGLPSGGHASPTLQLIRYTATVSGQSTAASQTIPQPVAPTAVASGADVTVSWTQTTLSGGTPVQSYTVRRYTTSGALQAIGTGCSTTVAALSCTEMSVPAGTWRYSVQPHQGSWTGPESAHSAAITVGPATLTLPSTPITVLPATLVGSIGGFTAGETLTFRLDSASGPVLSGTPASVPAGGAGSISVTIPAGTTDDPHSVFAVGSSGRTAAASINIVDPPALVSVGGRDVNGNGRVDRVVAVFDEPLAPYAAGVAPWTLTNVPSGGSLSNVTVAGATATLTLSEGPSAPATSMGGFTVALSANSAGIRDQAGHVSSFAPTAVADQAAPVAVTTLMRDVNTNGKIDQVAVTLSETVASYTAGVAPWTLTSVPSGGTLTSLTVSGATATLTLTEGSGAADTAVGGFTVAYTASSTGLRDSSGNLTSLAPHSPLDGAKPVIVGVSDTNGAADGRVEPGDTVSFTFSEPLVASAVPSTTSVVLADPPGNGNDTLALPGVLTGGASTGSNAHITSNNASATFAASAITLGGSGRVVTVTVGAVCTGTGCGAIGQATSSSTLSVSPAATLSDLTGNAAATTARAFSLRLF